MNVDKRIFELPPFMHRVYYYLTFIKCKMHFSPILHGDVSHKNFSAYRRQWMHLAITLKKSTKTTRIYINSVLKTTHTSTNSHANTYMVNNHKVFDVGLKRDNIEQRQFHGHLQDLAVFGRVLTQGEIAQISRK